LIGEACWWTLHPASKQRSEGEKVRVGDDLILVSVATERYLVTIHHQKHVAVQCFNFCSHLSQHTTKEKDVSIVNASFHVTHWSVAPFGTGLSRVKNVGMTLNYMPTFKFQLFQITTFFLLKGFLFGGEVLRFFHGGDECLTIPSSWSEQPGQKSV
jgi:ryanodine receptor 2